MLMSNITELKRKFYGKANKTFDDSQFIDNHQQYINTAKKYIGSQELFFNECPRFGRKCSMNMSFPINIYGTHRNNTYGTHRNFAFTNFRSNNPEYHKLIKSITLEIGGSQIDKVYGKIIPTLNHLFDLNTTQIPFYFNKVDYFLPFLLYHEIRFYFEFECETAELQNYSIDDLLFYVDVYEINRKTEFEHMITCVQFTGEEMMDPNCNTCKIRNDFNHVVTHLLVNSENCDINKMSLSFFKNNEMDLLDIPLTRQHNGIYIIPFVKSCNDNDIKQGINFSSIDSIHSTLWFNTKNKEEMSFINIYAININSMIMSNGMGGLRYAS